MDLGFQLGHTKLVPPTLNLVFLGVEIDTVESSLSLPHSEQTDLEALNAPFFSCTQAIKKQLRQLAGKLLYREM